MNKGIKIFTSDIFGEIRTCQFNNQIMFVGMDVATALGYSNTRDALRKHVDSEDKDAVAIRDSIGRGGSHHPGQCRHDAETLAERRTGGESGQGVSKEIQRDT